MRWLLALFALAALVAAPVAAQGGDPIGEAARASGFQGVYAVSSGGARVAGGSVGVADAASGTPFRYDMIFPLGPVTGQVIAAMAMQQVAAGRLSLDAPQVGGASVRTLLRQARYRELGEVLARVTKRPVAQLYVEQVVSANGMGALFAGPTDVRADAGWAGGPGADERAQVVASRGMVGTAEDVLAFDQALLDGRLIVDPRPLWALSAIGQSYSLSVPGCPAPVRVVEQRGTSGRFAASNLLLPDKGVALVLLTNRAETLGPARGGAAYAMLAALAGQGCK